MSGSHELLSERHSTVHLVNFGWKDTNEDNCSIYRLSYYFILLVIQSDWHEYSRVISSEIYCKCDLHNAGEVCAPHQIALHPKISSLGPLPVARDMKIPHIRFREDCLPRPLTDWLTDKMFRVFNSLGIHYCFSWTTRAFMWCTHDALLKVA